MAVVGTAISQVLMSGALSQVWGLINGLQLFVHLPLFYISMPANAAMLIKRMATIATFDIVDNEKIFGSWLFTFPEDNKPFNGRFSEIGYDSSNMISLMGIAFIIFTLVIVTMIILLITQPCLKYATHRFKCV